MVLDVKAMTWAAANNIDTAKLKAAHVPIFGKWYFPELPENVALINLETGERARFPKRMIAGELLWVAESDLYKAGLSPFPEPEPELPESGLHTPRVQPDDVEPLIAMNRSPGPSSEETAPSTGLSFATASSAFPPIDASEFEAAPAGGIHMPLASIAPFVLAVGISITLVGLISNVMLLIVGLLWSLAGTIGWIRIGLLEARSAAAGHGGSH